MVTIKDIAKRAGVAVSTVSYSLNNDPRIPEDTRIRILSLSKEMGYVGRSGKKSCSEYRKHIVICLHTLEGIIIPDIVRSLSDILRNSNCEALIYLGEAIENIRWMDGLIILNSKVTNAQIAEITKRKIPVILMDRNEKLDGTARVMLDNFNGMYELVQNVVKKGAKSFIFVGGPHSSYESRYRYEGFLQALNENKLNGKKSLYIHSDFTRKGGVKAARYFLSAAKTPDAVICANDEMAAGVTNVLRLEGMKIPQDIIVTGFDGNIADAYPGYITAKANHKDWANNAAFSVLHYFEHSRLDADVKIPVDVIEFN